MEFVYLEWLRAGSLPIYQVEQRTPYFYLHGEVGGRELPDRTLMWLPAESGRKMLLPMHETTLRWFLRSLEQKLPTEGNLFDPSSPGTLVISVRSVFTADTEVEWDFVPVTFVTAAVACVPDVQFVKAFPIADLGPQPLETIREFLAFHQKPPQETALPILWNLWAEHQEDRARERIEVDASQVRHREGLERAKRLLIANLDEEQRQEFEARQQFFVRAMDGRLYRVNTQDHANIDLIEEGRPTVNFCIVSSEYVPIYDQMLAQKLMLETDIGKLTEIANQYRFNS